MQYPRPHHGSTSEFQVSGFPFVTGSAADEVGTSNPVKVTFPYVTQFIQVSNIDADDGLFVGFTENGIKGTESSQRYFVPKNSAGPTIPVKCKEVFFLAAANTVGFTVVAGLTNVKDFPAVTGSNGFEGVG